MLKTKHVIRAGFLAKTRQIAIWLSMLTIISTSNAILPTIINNTNAASCPDLKVIFARGSGAPRYDNDGYQSFKASLEAKLKTSNLSYEFEDLDYPAVGVGIENLSNTIGAYIGGGESYVFGESMNKGVLKLTNTIIGDTCANTKYVLAGYSQGAMVVLKTLDRVLPERIIYAATFGDPKIYLPEGAGLLPSACRGDNLSEYRVYVPDCYAYKGILGAREPYVTTDYLGKVGTWCNKFDILCSSHFSVASHISYSDDGLYEDASKLIFSKIAATFGFKNEYTSPHDTAFLIDSTGSMIEYIDKYKSEALRLAQQTLDAGGRVALYDYRDLVESYTPVEHCSFETCTIEAFENGLEEIIADGGEDEPESLLSASLHVMNSQSWRLGSTKSLVILTDAGYHSPDRDGTTFYDVKSLSKKIDPVNFYIVTTPEHVEEYKSLAEATDGMVVTTTDDLGFLTDTIMERYDSLPRVEEEIGNFAIPSLTIQSSEIISGSEAKVSFIKDASSVIVMLNDMIIGITSEDSITFRELNLDIPNEITLIPLSSNVRGEAASLHLDAVVSPITKGNEDSILHKASTNETKNDIPEEMEYETLPPFFVPKAPDTGRPR